LLQDKFGLDKVTVTAASAVVTGDETAFDLLVLSVSFYLHHELNKFPY
jgi:hypothetical protein